MEQPKLLVLDGWRAVSILLVLVCHFFPLGPSGWYLGKTVGDFALTIFFILSGFLITNVLLKEPTVKSFLIRRFLRIIPLAWLYLIIVFLIYKVDTKTLISHFLFYANFPPKPLIVHVTDHFWSLCIEVQFYIGIALLYGFFKQRGLLAIPLICIAFTTLRVVNGISVSVITYYRVDEILAGSFLALVYYDRIFPSFKYALSKLNPYLLIPVLFIASHQYMGSITYFRPYIAASLIGATLLQPSSKLNTILINRYFLYIASTSYAIYVIHPLLAQTWLGSGDLIEKYAKRPLLLVSIFLIAHFSTHSYEKRAIALGKRLAG